MAQLWNNRAHDYEVPPPLISALTGGKTWALWCPKCPREVIVDVIGLLERHDIYDRVRLDKAVCKGCGGRLKSGGGYVIRALQHRGRIPRLVTADGSSWHCPALPGRRRAGDAAATSAVTDPPRPA
jgi:hypothetical protein